MNTKNKILVGILLLVILGVGLRLILGGALYQQKVVIASHAGVGGCMPAIVSHIAVDDGTIFTQGMEHMFIVDSNKESIVHLNKEKEDLYRHFYSNRLTFDTASSGVEIMTVNWIDQDTASFEFNHELGDQEKQCVLEVKGQWATPEKLQEIENRA